MTQVGDITEKEIELGGEKKRVKVHRYTIWDGSKIEVCAPPADAPEHVRNNWSPFVFVDPDDGHLPEQGYPIMGMAKMAQACCPDGDYQPFAEDLGIPLETVQRWVKDGLDWKKQTLGRGTVPVRPGDISEPANGDVRYVALHRNLHNRGVSWMPDWTQGELLCPMAVSAHFPKDHPFRVALEGNWTANQPFERGVRDLTGSWEGKPVILVGSGPSAAWQADELRAIHGHSNVKIISCNRGLRILGPEAIDYYVLMDWMGRKEWFDGLDCAKTELISYVGATSLAQAHWPKERIRWFISNLQKSFFPQEHERRDLGFILESGAVSISMLFFAFHVLRANPIILTGFDLSYPGLMEYPDQPIRFSEQMDIKIVQEPYTGKACATATHLQHQRAAIDMASFWIRKANRRIVNCTPLGLLKNPDRMRLTDAINRFVLDGEKASQDPTFRKIRAREAALLQGAQEVR